MADYFLDTFRLMFPDRSMPSVFVETGTFRGDNVASKIGLPEFKEIHSIELKTEYVDAARKRFENEPSVRIHHGDSGKVLNELVDTWKEPVMFFLDAHWSGGETAKGDCETPLIAEMKALGRRPYDDVVFIDDTRFFGRKMYGGTPGCSMWPYTEFDWRDVTLDKLLEVYGKNVTVHNCPYVTDRIVLVPPLPPSLLGHDQQIKENSFTVGEVHVLAAKKISCSK